MNSEFTAMLRKQIAISLLGNRAHLDTYCTVSNRVVKEACDRIDRLSVENNRLTDTLIAARFLGSGTQLIGDGRYKELLKAEAENKKLKISIAGKEAACKMSMATTQRRERTIEQLQTELKTKDEEIERLKKPLIAIKEFDHIPEANPDWEICYDIVLGIVEQTLKGNDE